MPSFVLARRSSDKAAALIIVLAFVVLLTGLSLAYFSRTTSERQLAHSSYNDTSADLLARTALDVIVSDFKQEIVNGSTATTVNGSSVYTPLFPAYMVPQRSGSSSLAPNLIRRSVANDQIPPPGLPSRASAVNTVTDASANKRSMTLARWNTHYLLPKANAGNDDSYPPSPLLAPFNPYTPVPNGFTPPDWVFVTDQGPAVITAPNTSIVGRYAYALYAEGGLLDMNVAGYPMNTTVTESGRKGSLAYADLTALGNYPIPNGSGGAYQVDKLVGWRNYATAQPNNNFPDSNFAANFQSDPTRAAAYFTSIINNTNGFLSPSNATWNNRTDQSFVQRKELVALFTTLRVGGLATPTPTPSFLNALQYLSTFSRETNAPSFSPSTPQGSTIDYGALATTATAVNPNFLFRRVTSAFTRFDGTSAVIGEPLVKTRFPLSRLAWITYKGPSASLAITDPVYVALINAGVSAATLSAGTAANIKKCFGLTFPTGGAAGSPWTYTNPTGTTGASRILRLDEVATAAREPDFFELLQGGILSGSLGQSTAPPPGTSGGGTTGGNVFPDVHMSSTMQHLLTIGACIIDQADPDSIPTRIQFTGTNGNTWTAYGVENLPYITQMYPIAGQSYDDPTKWSTYLLFQLWNPQANASVLPVSVRLRVDGGIGIFAGGNGETWNAGSADFFNASGSVSGQSVTLNSGASFSAPLPLSNQNTTAITSATPGTFGTLTAPAIPTPTPTPTATPTPTPTPTASVPANLFVGFRLPDFPATPTPAATPATNNMQLWLQVGATHGGTTYPFNATLEVDASGNGTAWVPYNHFVGITDPSYAVKDGWITNAPLRVRELPNSSPAPSPYPSPPAFSTAQLATETPAPAVYMKADPRSTRFGIFQMDTNPTGISRIMDSLWPSASSTLPNGYGGSVVDPGGPVEHAPNRFSGAAYYPATFSINGASDARDNATTIYADNDSVTRAADAIYPGAATTTGASTPYYAGSMSYYPIMLNRPFRNVAELGYAFRDLPWKTLDFFTDKSADAGLLDIFCIHDGPQSTTAYSGNNLGNVVPTMVAGKVNLNSVYLDPSNSAVAPVGQPILAGAIWDEIASSTVVPTGSGAQTAQTMMGNLAAATSAAPMQNKSELITRTNLPATILPTASNDLQSVKAQREVVARAVSSVSQTRVWNLLIDVIAQSGHFKPNATSLQNDFVVEGEEHYWVHVAIDRFTGQVIDKQTEVVKE